MLRKKVSEEHLSVLANNDFAIHISGIDLSHRLSASATGRHDAPIGNRHHCVDMCFPMFQHFGHGCDFCTESQTGGEIDTDPSIDVSIGRTDGGTHPTSREFVLQGEVPADGSGSFDQFSSRLFHVLTPKNEYADQHNSRDTPGQRSEMPANRRRC